MRSRAPKTRSFLFVAINGDGLPQWIELIPAGKFSAVDGRGPFENSDPDSIVATTVAKMPRAGLVLDYDHSTDLAAPEGRPAPAAGWLKQFRVEGGAIFARIEWTAEAADAVKAKKYRYLSPVFEHGKDGKIERILRAALTNNPALINLPALASAEARLVENTRRSGAEPRSPVCDVRTAERSGAIQKMAKEEKKMKLSEVMAVLEEAYPDAGPEKLMKAAACLMAEDDTDDDDDDGDGDDGDNTDAPDAADGDPYGSENGDQMASRQADEMAKCASDDEKANCAAKHAAEKDRFAKRNFAATPMAAKPGRKVAPALAAGVGIRKMTNEEIEKHIAKHPMVVKMAGEINSLRSEQAKEAATQRVETAIREGRLIPAQRDWAVAYCSSDAEGFEKFLGAQPRIIQSGPDGTFTGRIGEAKDDQLSKRELSVCENLGVTAEKFAAAKKVRLSHNVHLD